MPDTGSPGSTPPGTSTSSPKRPGSDSGDARSSGSETVARTPAERRADIDGQLDASLGKFDEQLRREQQRNASERDTRTASRADGAAVGEVASGRDGAGEIGRDRSGDLRSDSATTVASTGQGAGAVGTQGGGGAAAKPIPSGEDDDIIARRLRKAAEAETDPELKEKLWKEYRDYKENTGRS
jgi:hypothetical protein